MSIFGLIGVADLETTMKKMSKFQCTDYLIVTKEMTVEEVVEKSVTKRFIRTIELLDLNDIAFSNSQLFVFFKALLQQKITIRFIEKVVEVDDAAYFQLIYSVLQRDYDFKSRTQKEKLREAKEKGVQLGRPGISETEIAEIILLRKKQKLTYQEIADRTGISIGTVAKYSKQGQRYPR